MRWMVAFSFLLVTLLCLRPHGRPRPQDVRTEMLQLMGQNAEFYRACMDNLKNEYTPGYRANEVFTYLNSPRGPRPRVRFSQGQLRETRSPYDVAIDGNGFFLLSNGTLTRDGNWIYGDGKLWVGKDRDLFVLGSDRQALDIPKDGTNLEITGDGQVKITRLNGDGKPEVVGQLGLTQVPNPDFLERDGNNFKVNSRSGPVEWVETPGKNGMGVVTQGYLELSNVNALEQMKTAQALRNYAGLLGAPPDDPFQP